MPKIVTEDTAIFMGLIGDLFPALDVPRKRDLEFEKQVRQAAIDLKLQPEDNFILKVPILYLFCYFGRSDSIANRICFVDAGNTAGGIVGSQAFGFYNRFGRYGQVRGMENATPDLFEYEIETALRRYRAQSSHQRRAIWCHQFGYQGMGGR